MAQQNRITEQPPALSVSTVVGSSNLRFAADAFFRRLRVRVGQRYNARPLRNYLLLTNILMAAFLVFYLAATRTKFVGLGQLLYSLTAIPWMGVSAHRLSSYVSKEHNERHKMKNRNLAFPAAVAVLASVPKAMPRVCNAFLPGEWVQIADEEHLKTAAPNAGIGLRFSIGHQWPGVGDPGRPRVIT